MGEFGELWSEKFKDDKDAFPSMIDVIGGLYRLYYSQIQEKWNNVRK